MAATSVVVVDQWPLVRLGIGRALPSLSFRVVEEVAAASQAAVAVRRRRPRLVIIGNHLESDPVPLVLAAREVGAAVLVLVDGAARAELAALAGAGADGILTGSASAEEVAQAAQQVLAGQRALSPSLVPALVGLGPTRPETPCDNLLTERERQVLACLVRGARNEEIASELFLSPATVKTHLTHIYTKLEVRGRHEATARAIQLGLVG